MIEKIFEVNYLGNQEQLKYILGLLSLGKHSLNDLRIACSSYEYNFSSSFDGVLNLLQWLEIIQVYKDIVTLSINYETIFDNQNKISHSFFGLLFNHLEDDCYLTEFLNNDNLKYSNDDKLIIIKNNLISLKFSQLRNLLINLNFFKRDELIQNQFLIHEYYQSWFISNIIPLIEKQEVKNSISLKKLKSKLSLNEKIGKEAEDFVLKFERKRLSEHIRYDDIKPISEESANAGYDIQSFNNNASIIIDRFIEVKSFEGSPHFYWSKNEVDVAKLKKDTYFLYLVDRKKMKLENYEPEIIQNSFHSILDSDEWIKEVDKWFITLKNDEKSL